MATRHSTAPARAGERSRSPSPHILPVPPTSQGGPVTRAIRAVRGPSSGLTPKQALDNLRSGLDYLFGQEPDALDLAAQMDVERSRIHELREAIAHRLEAEFAVLDALDGGAGLESGADAEAGPFERGFASWHGEMFGGVR